MSDETPAQVVDEEVVESTTAYRGFLFSDLRGYTSYLERRGDQAGAELLDRYRGIVRRTIARYEGAEIRTEGDGFYVVFPSASSAVLCGVAITGEALTASRSDPTRPIAVGVGVHAGETVERPEGFVGSAVNLAARVCAVAQPGEVLVTDTVRALTRSNVAVRFVSRGRRRLKGIDEPVALFRAEGATTVAPASVRQSRPIFTAIGAVVIAVVVGLLALANLWGGGGGPLASTTASTSPGQSGTSPTGGQSPVVVSTPTAFPGPGLIAYVTGSETDPGTLMLVNPASAAQTELVPSTANSWVSAAAWAPDGQHIAYAVVDVTADTHALWVARPDGSDARKVAITGTGPASAIFSLSWAPDSQQIVFSSANRLSIIAVGDGTISPLTSNATLIDYAPAWSPDGSRIAFTRTVNDETAAPEAGRIWTIGVDGSGAAQLRASPDDDEDNAAWSPDGTRLAFDASTPESGGRDIYVTSSTGTSLTRLTNDPRQDFAPSWSPDGTHIAFVSDRNRQPTIYIMAADGSDQQPLVSNSAAGATITRPVWGRAEPPTGPGKTPPASPSATPAATIAISSLAGNGRIAFIERDNSTGQAIMVMDADGTNKHRVLFPITEDGLEDITELAWSRDGSRLAVNVVGGTGPATVWVVNQDGTEPHQFVAEADTGVSWAPDGNRIAFSQPAGDGEPARFRIAILDLATGDVTPLPIEDSASARQPRWSPDGSGILFVKQIGIGPDADQTGPPALWIMKPDGSDARALLSLPQPGDSAMTVTDPAWSPDGSWIAFAGFDTQSGEASDIYVTNSHGTTFAQLTSGPGFNLAPSWSPDSQLIVFSSDRDFQTELYVMRADGSAPTRLTYSAEGGSSTLPAWGP
jgi:Tol biopolymer transport system component/class 3 adenylate cyclase